jgi:hypothetical protein
MIWLVVTVILVLAGWAGLSLARRLGATRAEAQQKDRVLADIEKARRAEDRVRSADPGERARLRAKHTRK